MSWTYVHPEVDVISQATASTCWLAALKMLYVWNNRPVNEPLDKLNEDPNIFPDYWLENGLAPDNCLTIARCLGLGCAGDGDADAEVLARALKSHGPYWVAGEWKKGYAHVKVVVGCDPDMGKVKLLNPWNPLDSVDYADIDGFNKRGDRWKVFGSFMYWH